MTAIAMPWVPRRRWQTAWEIPTTTLDDIKRRWERLLRLEMLGLMPMLGPRSGGAWQSTATATLSGGDIGASWHGYTMVQFIDQASLLVTGGTQVRHTFQAPSANAWQTTSVYTQKASNSYSVTSPAFSTTPVQNLFSGAGTFTLASGASDLVSDAIALSIPVADGLCIAWHNLNTAGNGNIPAHATLPANWKMSSTGSGSSTDDAATVAKTGYTDRTAQGHAFGIKKIEVFA